MRNANKLFRLQANSSLCESLAICLYVSNIKTLPTHRLALCGSGWMVCHNKVPVASYEHAVKAHCTYKKDKRWGNTICLYFFAFCLPSIQKELDIAEILTENDGWKLKQRARHFNLITTSPANQKQWAIIPQPQIDPWKPSVPRPSPSKTFGVALNSKLH